VSYAEKLIPAADISEQISTAGKEASGTGNMKLMLNGAVTLGTLDGANVEIVEQSGSANNYIFGATVEQIQAAEATYDPMEYYLASPRIKRVMDALIDGTLKDGGTGLFKELYESILEGKNWHRPDQYFLLLDFDSYCDAKLRAIRDYGRDKAAFTKKCLINTATAGRFSSDRTIREYAEEIWGV
jgi:starch phosphorylase